MASSVELSNKQGKIKVALAASPRLSLNNPASEVSVMITASLESPLHTGHPFTLCTEKNVFEVFKQEDGGVDMFARGAFGLLQSISGDGSKNISLGFLRVNERDFSDSADLRERGYRFITIPGEGSPVLVTHKLDWERIFRYEGKRKKEDLVPGE
jgi:hypothetical protein